MPELLLKERLQPSLLDRLTDDRPQDKNESRDARVLTVPQLRASVLRDLCWLLNCEAIGNLLDSAGRSAASRTSSRNCASRVCGSNPWHRKQASARIGRTSRLYSSFAGSAASADAGGAKLTTAQSSAKLGSRLRGEWSPSIDVPRDPARIAISEFN